MKKHAYTLHNLSVIGLALAAAFGLSGCETLTHGDSEGIAIKSMPSNATIAVDGKERGMTPKVVSVSRTKDHVVTLSHPGYLIYKTKLTSSHHFGHSLWNDGPIGGSIDALSGADDQLKPEQIDAHLAPTIATQEANASKSYQSTDTSSQSSGS